MGLKKLMHKITRRHPVDGPRTGTATQIMSPSYISNDTIIGSYTYIGHNANITRAVIGNYCSIGNYVCIGPGEHDLTQLSTSHHFYTGPNWYDALTAQDCIIGNDVWIGVGAIIRRGVTVGNGAVIGANSFVNRDVPPFAVVAGCPARIIKYRFAPDKIKRLEKSHWWDMSPDAAAECMKRIK